MSFNKVILIGNLGADPEVKTFDNGTEVTNFTLATNENYKDKEGQWQKKTEWHKVKIFRKLDYLKKGDQISLEGKIVYRQYTDPSGTVKYITEIEAKRVIKLNHEVREELSNNSPY